ncbi:MAG: FGGY family carbohydrate kinase [Chthoniobacterales bacterium]
MPQHDLVLGLDVGTTNIKCLAIDNSGNIVAHAALRTPHSHPRAGWTDFEPEEIWNVVSGAIRAVVSQLESREVVRGIAVASVGESLVPMDSDGKPLAPAIAWFDLRTVAEYAWICDRIGYNKLFQVSGLNPDPMFGLCKVLWVKNHQAEAFQRTKSWLSLADYVAFRLSGVAATDPSLACRTLAYNLSQGSWERGLLEDIGIEPSSFPPVLRSGTPLGPVTVSAASDTDLPTTTIVSVGVHDHISGSFAASGLAGKVLVDSIGTSEMLLTVSDHPKLNPRIAEHGLAQGAVWIDRPIYYLTGGIFTAGSAIEWFRRELGGNADFAGLINEATGVEEAVPVFLPHLVRSLTPYPDAQVSGAFVGLKPTTTRGAMFRAVLEGLAFEARAILDAMVTVAGQPHPAQIITIGGSQQNRLLAQIKSDVYGSPLKISPIREVVSFGAALLAGIGSGIFANASEAASVARRTEIDLEPNAEQSTRLQSRYEAVYRELFAQLRPINHRLHSLAEQTSSAKQLAHE